MLSKELYPVFAGDNPTIGQRPMEDGLVSVIVNVYDCKDYLPTSLDSVRQQTYSNLEVILVDDCSTDGSGDFCDEYCLQDERFCVIHHEMNTGVSGPRNTGLKAARGEDIYFLDGDDYESLALTFTASSYLVYTLCFNCRSRNLPQEHSTGHSEGVPKHITFMCSRKLHCVTFFFLVT